MKKQLIALTMFAALGMGAALPTAAQQNKNNQPTELVDTTGQDELEAYSDTTATVDDSTVVSRGHRIGGYVDSDGSFVKDIFSNIGVEGMMGMAFVLMIIVIIFILAPVIILAVLFFFIYKNRKQKIRLAEMAMKQGQPIPDQLLNEKPIDADDEYQKGMRQCFVGVGLMIFLGYAAGNVGFGIGALVFCIGLGKVFASKTAQKRKNEFGNDDSLTPNV